MKRHRSGSLLCGGHSNSLGPSPPKISKVAAGSTSGTPYTHCDMSTHRTARELALCPSHDMANTVVGGSSVSETETRLKELMSLFPVAVFEGQLPPIVLRHQLYSVIDDRTLVDRELVRS